jgi:hypothetical protein
MGDQLMTEEIEVDPFVRTPPSRTSEQVPVKLFRRSEIIDRNGEVE